MLKILCIGIPTNLESIIDEMMQNPELKIIIPDDSELHKMSEIMKEIVIDNS